MRTQFVMRVEGGFRAGLSGLIVDCIHGNVAAQNGIQGIVQILTANRGLGFFAEKVCPAGNGGSAATDQARQSDSSQPDWVTVVEATHEPERFVISCRCPVSRIEAPSEALLECCYYNALCLAEQYRLVSLAFPAAPGDMFGFPPREAAQIALGAVIKEAPRLCSIKLVRFVLHREEDMELYAHSLLGIMNQDVTARFPN